MALYQYQGFSREGKRVSGHIDAPSVSGARELLARQNIYISSINLADAVAARATGIRRFFQRAPSMKDKIFFTKQLAVLLKSGVPLLQALELLVDQSEGALRTIVARLKDEIKEGSSLADALARHPKVFDNIYIQIVRAGEASGKLEIILERLTRYLERRQEIVKKVRSALSYPIFQLFIVAGVVVVLLTYVVPQIASTFSAQGAELPLTTRILMGTSNFLTGHYVILTALLFSIFFGFRTWKRTESGARTIDKLKLKLPVIRYFAKTGAVVQFSRTLGMLIESGVNLAESLNIVVKIIDNRILVDALNEAKENIIKQGKISQYLGKTGLFPPIAIYLINTGEQSGQLDTMLLTVAEYYETELSEAAESLASKIEPIMLLVMAVIVGFIVISIVTPLFSLNKLAEL